MFAADFSNKVMFFDAITTGQDHKLLVHFAESDILTKDLAYPFEKLRCLYRHTIIIPKLP
jgi:hypothetical protein